MENNRVRAHRNQLEKDFIYLELFIAFNEKSIFNPMYYIDYPEFEKVEDAKLELENIKYTLRMINE